QNITASEFVCAGVLLAISIQAYLSWSGARTTRIPVWSLVCAAHFVFYGVAIFGALRQSPSGFDHGSDLPDSALTMAMLVGIVGLLFMGAEGTLPCTWMAQRCLGFRFLLCIRPLATEFT